jgi:hypothetical protein
VTLALLLVTLVPSGTVQDSMVIYTGEVEQAKRIQKFMPVMAD